MIDADEGQRKMFAGHAGSSLAATRRLPVHSPLRCGLPNPHGIWGRNDGGIMVVDLEKKNKNNTKIPIGNHIHDTEGSRLLVLESPWVTAGWKGGMPRPGAVKGWVPP